MILFVIKGKLKYTYLNASSCMQLLKEVKFCIAWLKFPKVHATLLIVKTCISIIKLHTKIGFFNILISNTIRQDTSSC